MGEKLEIDVNKILKKHILSRDREHGVEIDSCIPHGKYILKGNKLILASYWDGLFAVDLELLPKLAAELLEISRAYDISDCRS